MRPGGRYDRTSYRDSRPGRHATRAAELADALDEFELAVLAVEGDPKAPDDLSEAGRALEIPTTPEGHLA